MKLMNAVVPYTRSAGLARAANASNKQLGRSGIVRGVPGFPKGIKLGNMPAGLSDYINTPGTPGSSTFYMYGLGQDEDYGVDDAFASTATDSVNAASPPVSTTGSFASAIQSIVGSVATLVPAYVQLTAQQSAQQQLAAGKITPAQYAQLVGAAPPAGTLPFLTRTAAGTGIGTGALLLIAAALGGFLLLRK